MLDRLIFSVRDGRNYYVQATANQNERRALPEEIIRQLFVLSLLHDYKCPEDRIHLEWQIQVGRERKRADIVVLDMVGNVLVIVEIKVETDQHSMAQLKSYMALTRAKYGALISVSAMECQMRSDTGVFSAVRDIPLFDEMPLPLTGILPNATTGSTALPNDGQMRPEGAAEAAQEFPLKQLIGIEQFERVSNTLAKITIKGSTLSLPIEEIDSYKKLRQRFIQAGVALIPGVQQAEWFALFRHLLESKPVPEQAMAPVSSVLILVEYLNAHIGERLVFSRPNAGMTAQNVRPPNGLSQRYEKDTHTLWVSRKHIKHYLDTNHFDYTRTRDELKERGILLNGNSGKVLGAGTDQAGGQTPCWKIRANHPELGALISEPA